MQSLEDVIKEIKKDKIVYNKILGDHDYFRKIIEQIGLAYCDKLTLEGEFDKYYNQLIYYFTQNDKFDGDLKKGIFILGNVGRGKTLSMLIMKKFCAIVNKSMNFRYIDSEELNLSYGEVGSNIFGSYRTGGLLINGMGDEKHTDVKHYGSAQNPIALLLKIRYDIYQQRGLLTHATGNWDYDELKKIYGVREISRCYEMFNLLNLKGKDMRKQFIVII